MATRKPIELQRFPKPLRDAVSFGVLPASIRYVVDGDTVGCLVDRGGAKYVFETIRLADVWADELNDPDPQKAERGRAAKAYLERLLPEGRKVLMIGRGMDDRDRIVARVEIAEPGISDRIDVGDSLVAAGYARRKEMP